MESVSDRQSVELVWMFLFIQLSFSLFTCSLQGRHKPDRCVERLFSFCEHGWTCSMKTSGRTERQMDGWTDGWMEEQVSLQHETCLFKMYVAEILYNIPVFYSTKTTSYDMCISLSLNACLKNSLRSVGFSTRG